MSIALRTKYLSIKKEKLSETGKTVLKSMYDATDGFKDAKATRKIKPKFEAFYDKLKKSKPEAIKGATKPKETSAAKQFKEARERRKSQTGVPKKESDIKKDADRPAIDRKGKRVTDGTHYPYKKGNVYYEYRDNRYDKRPAKYPKLEDGGHVQGYDDREDERLSMEHSKMSMKDLHSTHARRDDARFEERMADGGMMSKGGELKSHKVALYKNDKGGVTYIPLEGKERMYNKAQVKQLIKDVYGKTIQGSVSFEDTKEWDDEMYKQVTGKKEDGGMMAKGGELKSHKVALYKNDKGGVTYIPLEGKERMYNKAQVKQLIKDVYGKTIQGSVSFEDTKEWDDEMYKQVTGKKEDGGMMAKGGKMRSQEEYNELVMEKDKLVKSLSPKEVAEMWNKNSPKNPFVSTKMTLAEAKTANGKMYLRDLLVENELTKAEFDKYFEHGGMMAYGGMTPGRWYKDNQGNEFKYIGPDSTGRVLFNDGERVINKSLDDFEPNVKENKMFSWFEDGGETHRGDGGDQLFADGGKTDNGNVEMVMSNTKAIEHHAQELKKLVDMNTPIEAWVVAKLERAETDLSDVTHYIDGLKSKFADGGELEGHEVEIFFNTKDKVADPYTVIVDGSVYSMSGTTGPYSVNLYVGEIDEFSPQAVKGWGKKINFVNAEPELISQIESRFEDEMANGGMMAKGGLVVDKIKEIVIENGFTSLDEPIIFEKINKDEEWLIEGVDESGVMITKYVHGNEVANNEIAFKDLPEKQLKSIYKSLKEQGLFANGGMMADGGELDKYIEVNGTFYQKGTPQAVINALESARNNRTRVKIFYGDPETGRDWHEEHDTTGTIGRSTGSIKIPLLISTSRSSGGGAILTKNIVKIRDTQSGRVLYQNEKYKQPNIEIVESTTDGYTHDVLIDGELYSRHKTNRSAELLKSKMMAGGGETSKFEVDDVVYHKGFNTVGIVRIAEERGEVKTDADGNVNADELEYYNPMKHESHKSAKIAPSTYKEVEERGLWQPFSERTSTLANGGMMANGGYLAGKTSVEVGNEKISVIKRRKEKTGYPVYVNTQGYAPMTLDVYPTKELATKKAKALANKEGYTFSNWEKVGEFNLEPYAKGGRLSRKQKQLDLNKNGKLDSQDFKMLRAKRKNARKK